MRFTKYFKIILFNKDKEGFKYRAALNALAAKAIFEKMSEQNRELVINRVIEIHKSMSLSISKGEILRKDEHSLYGHLALAMAELGVRPPIDNMVWSPVQNPASALLNASKQLEAAKMEFKKSGINIGLN